MKILVMRALCSKPFLQEKKVQSIFRNQFLEKKKVQNRIGAKEFGFFFAEKRINGKTNLKNEGGL
jgi:hypothetical protein